MPLPGRWSETSEEPLSLTDTRADHNNTNSGSDGKGSVSA